MDNIEVFEKNLKKIEKEGLSDSILGIFADEAPHNTIEIRRLLIDKYDLVNTADKSFYAECIKNRNFVNAVTGVIRTLTHTNLLKRVTDNQWAITPEGINYLGVDMNTLEESISSLRGAEEGPVNEPESETEQEKEEKAQSPKISMQDVAKDTISGFSGLNRLWKDIEEEKGYKKEEAVFSEEEPMKKTKGLIKLKDLFGNDLLLKADTKKNINSTYKTFAPKPTITAPALLEAKPVETKPETKPETKKEVQTVTELPEVEKPAETIPEPVPYVDKPIATPAPVSDPKDDIMALYKEYREMFLKELANNLIGMNTEQFESLILKIFEKMGYEYITNPVSKPLDEHIVKLHDKNGFSLLYLYIDDIRRENSEVNIRDMFAFAGAIGNKTEQGIFCSMYGLSEDAKEFAENQNILTLGLRWLTEKMEEYQIGVKTESIIRMSAVDKDFLRSL